MVVDLRVHDRCADYYVTHETATPPYWFELNWWFPQLAMLFIIASWLVGFVARMPEKEIVRLIGAGAADMIGPAMVVLLAGGVSVIMNNTPDPGHDPQPMEQLVSGASAGVFAIVTVIINIPQAFLIPSSSGHGALAMPPLAPLVVDFAGVSRATTITAAWITGHGWTLLWSPTSVVVVGGLAIAKGRGYDKYPSGSWPAARSAAGRRSRSWVLRRVWSSAADPVAAPAVADYGPEHGCRTERLGAWRSSVPDRTDCPR